MTRQTTTDDADSSTGARRPGRPRSAAVHKAILEAAEVLFVEEGFEGMSVEAVATRAGVGKATIYRRWTSKEALVMDAVIRAFDEPARPDTGNVRDDLVQGGRELATLMSSSPAGDVFPRMGAEVARKTPLGRLYAQRVVGPRRAIFEQALHRGIERGELSRDTDIELAVDHLVGILLLRRLTGRLKASDANALAERAVDMLLPSLTTEGR